jgi:hypothetical protein
MRLEESLIGDRRVAHDSTPFGSPPCTMGISCATARLDVRLLAFPPQSSTPGGSMLLWWVARVSNVQGVVNACRLTIGRGDAQNSRLGKRLIDELSVQQIGNGLIRLIASPPS